MLIFTCQTWQRLNRFQSSRLHLVIISVLALRGVTKPKGEIRIRWCLHDRNNASAVRYDCPIYKMERKRFKYILSLVSLLGHLAAPYRFEVLQWKLWAVNKFNKPFHTLVWYRFDMNEQRKHHVTTVGKCTLFSIAIGGPQIVCFVLSLLQTILSAGF